MWGRVFIGTLVTGSGLYSMKRTLAKDVAKIDHTEKSTKYQGNNASTESKSAVASCDNHSSFATAISNSKEMIKKLKDDHGCPGMSVAVSVNGDIVWKEGFGFADVENSVRCTPETAMKIASISKPLTITMLMKLWEMGAIDLDDNIKSYIKYWPDKYYKGQKVTITPRLLASHKGGVRNYKRIVRDQHGENTSEDSHHDFEFEEYYIKDRYKTVKEALLLFMDDDLIARPGDKFHYSNHGYSVISAVLEGATSKTFPVLAKNLFKDLGMMDTHLDDKNKLIYNRASYYVRGSDGEIYNAPFVESSFKWAGAGMISTVLDLVKFGNIILYGYQNIKETGAKFLPGYLKSDTVKLIWKPQDNTKVSWHNEGMYGLGWQVIPDSDGDGKIKYVGHTGGTIGASCALIIRPTQDNITRSLPKGIVVVILSNIQGISLGNVAVEIASNFEKCSDITKDASGS